MIYAKVVFQEGFDEPVRSIFYEVDAAQNVLRMVTFRAAGELVRESLSSDPLATNSLLESAFPSTRDFSRLSDEECSFLEIQADEFEDVWAPGLTD